MNKAKILVVEDDKAVRNLITTTLETQNYQYHTAEKGSEALLEVDGGVTAENAQLYTGPGATLLVSGTGVFHAADRAAAIAKMKVRP